MSRINTNIGSLYAINSLNNNETDLETHLQRLSTGLQINSGADNPAGLIASQGLQSQIAGINQAIDNSTQATNVLNTADGALSETSNLLLQLQSLVNQSANTGALSSDELSANQLQVDSIVNSVNRIANTTQFDGTNLLNGTLAYTTSSINATDITNASINSAQIPNNGTLNIAVQVTASAKVGTLAFASSGIGTTPTTIAITGNIGTDQLTFAASAHNSAISLAINQVKADTGVSASVLANGHLDLYSTQYGSANYVSVKTIQGSFVNGKSDGANAGVTINGNQADVQGTQASIRTGTLDVTLNLSNTFAQTVGATSNFYVTGGGANFQLGSEVNAPSQTSIGIQSIDSNNLGSSATGYLSSLASGGANALTTGNTTQAQTIVNAAVSQVATLSGRIGAFEKDVLSTNSDTLNVALENVTSSESDIEDANFATETAAEARDQVLVQADTAVLSSANSTPQNVLSLLQHL
jgi:flagellin